MCNDVLNVLFNRIVVSPACFAAPLLFSNNDLNQTLEEMVAQFKEWYPDMLS